MSGLPEYDFIPNFIPSAEKCTTQFFSERRARLIAGGTFFRCKTLGLIGNEISLEAIIKDNLYSLNVYLKNKLVETYNIKIDPVTYYQYNPYNPVIPQSNALKLIEELNFPKQEIQNYGPLNLFSDLQNNITSSVEYDKLRLLIEDEKTGSKFIEMPPRGYDVNDAGEDAQFLQSFTITSLTGGEGPPIDDAILPILRTGPTRSIVILSSTENIIGENITPPADRKLIQWDGTNWIPYIQFT